ncbi:MAG: hypothetical protein PHX10_12520, partial [Gallionellaceae bacterium]|nr:hypothetical protein [Gallionellaceae bacterium]
GAIGQLGKGTVDSTAQSLAETFFSRFDQVMRGQLPVDDGAGALDRLWGMMPPWGWAISTLVLVFIVYWGLHGTW